MLDQLAKLAQNVSAQEFVTIQVQLANVVIQVGCFKQLEKLAEKFSESSTMMMRTLSRIEQHYSKIEDMLYRLERIVKWGGLDAVNTVVDNDADNGRRDCKRTKNDKIT